MNTRSHVLLAHARTYPRRDLDLTPPGCTYDIETGAWVTSRGELLVESQERPRPPQSKKSDVETGEDQKGY